MFASPLALPHRLSVLERTMATTRIILVMLLGLLCGPLAQAQETLFSGPQVGEPLPPLPVRGLTGEWAGKKFDALDHIKQQPTLLVFFHTLTRPAFGMTRALAKFADTKKSAGMQTVIVFLTNDATETEQWAKILPRQMPDGPIYCLSPEGVEGPGAYGLNRNVTLTILVAKDGVVTANSALAQPQLQADGKKILQAIVEVTGGGPVPSIAEIEGQPASMAATMRGGKAATGYDDPQFKELLRKVINKQADAAAVKQAATEVEAFVKQHTAAQTELGRIANTIVKSDKLGNYGTAVAQDILRQWAKQYSPEAAPEAPTTPEK